MSTITINIGADVEDTYFKNEQEWIYRIVDAAHKNNRVIINLNEGPALEELNYRGKKFIVILKELCENNNWPLEKFHLTTMNLIQNKKIWPSISINYIGGHFLSAQQSQIVLSRTINKTFGMFVGRSSWDRLLLASHLYNNHKERSYQTYRSYLDSSESMINLDLDRLCWLSSCDKKLNTNLIDSITNLIKSLPLLIGDSHKNITHIQWNSGAVDKEILSWYNNIFVDVVCEKTVTGQTFFPTEKTARPLATKTPFLIMSAPNYIKNLRQLGFRSFGQFWDENYDYQSGFQRVESIQRIIDNLAKMNQSQLQELYQKMLPILEHNYKIYQELTPKKIESIFN